MSQTLSRLTLTAALLTPVVTLDWSVRRIAGGMLQQRATIGAWSDVVIQAVEPGDDPDDPAHGISAWSRPTGPAPDPFPIRFWGFTPCTDGAGWQHIQRSIHHHLLMKAQAQVLLTRKPLTDALCGLRIKDIAAARRTITLVSGRESRADSIAGLLQDLHAAT